ncbi:F-box/kelch-repeat protein At3g23880-like isoform X3 [Vicia villosa]|uniref:F-box/kelch-repeat protein At3g23880-like isoform X3 n=1 Tax=Vicia villosa TaxID=3911 RepID=UPI00273B858D|nr:F-box/kelch-repeat protein At3g23880-like isoform X3 [Vicia villosa]
MMASQVERRNPNSTMFNRDAVKHLLQFRCVANFWNSLMFFARKHFKRNPNIINLSPILPFDLITEILSRVPVKLLLQFRCVCKSWNSLISHDPNFAKKHFKMSTTPNLHVISYDDPSKRKFKELPPFEKPQVAGSAKFGFGYDHLSHSYKVVVLYNSYRCDIIEDTIKIKIYNLRTNSWRSFQKLPFTTEFGSDQSGVYVSGTINWLASTKWLPPLFIVSFDLGKDSYKKIFPPEHAEFDGRSKLCVLKDCLCIICDYDIWIMKEYGIKESWTKLFKLSNLPGQRKGIWRSYLTKALDIFEDDQVLLVERWNKKLIVYDFKNDTFKVTSLFPTLPEICTESLISPCS